MEAIEFRKTRAHLTPTTRAWKVWRPPTRWRGVLEDLRTGGKDPIFRRNMLISLALHAIVIFGPYLWGMFFTVTDYQRPGDGGVRDPRGVSPPREVKVKATKQKPRRKFMFRAINTTILFHAPDIFDSAVSRAVDTATQLTYDARENSAHDLVRKAQTSGGSLPGGNGLSNGQVGRNNKTGKPGWDGDEKAVVRFIRLDHGGPDWDDGMQTSRASDINFLKAFHALTKIKVAPRSEFHAIALLKNYREGMAPPFVYMTGTGAINASDSDVKILREYLLDGGMLIGDCGSPAFDTSFRALMAAVFPDHGMVDISDDDMIFREPFGLPNGAPPIFHHAGTKARGVNIRGRWAVFYHPGDLKDAFRIGHSGLSPTVVKEAEQLGANIICYAFSHYVEAMHQNSR